MVDHFESKVVLITGGNSGIGQATALAFAKNGAKVIVAARRVSEGKATVAMFGGHVFCYWPCSSSRWWIFDIIVRI